MDVDKRRKLVFMARDPRSFAGTTGNDNSVSGVYIVDLRDPRDIKLITFTQVPTGHTTTCINDCQYLWTGGPASSAGQLSAWPGGRPIFVTDVRDPRNPKTAPQPIDLFRDDGVTAYSHDVQVDSEGIAWVSGAGPVRGYWTTGQALRPAQGRQAAALRRSTRSRTRAGGSPSRPRADGFMHNSYRRGNLLMATAEVDAPPDCETRRAVHDRLAEGQLPGPGVEVDAGEAVPAQDGRPLEPARPGGHAGQRRRSTARRTTST